MEEKENEFEFEKLTGEDFQRIEICHTKNGFCIWANEKDGNGTKHWLLDASTIFKDGKITLPDNEYIMKKCNYAYHVILDKKEQEIKIVKLINNLKK